MPREAEENDKKNNKKHYNHQAVAQEGYLKKRVMKKKNNNESKKIIKKERDGFLLKLEDCPVGIAGKLSVKVRMVLQGVPMSTSASKNSLLVYDCLCPETYDLSSWFRRDSI